MTAVLRDEVERVKQSVYEQEVSYNRQFRGVANAAYSATNRNADQNCIFVRAYAQAGFAIYSNGNKLDRSFQRAP